MKLSEVTNEIKAQHCRTSAADPLLPLYWDAAVQSVLSYTGLTPEEADKYADLTIAALILTSDMYDNRQVQVDTDKVSKVFESFVGSHDFNLLPGQGDL